MTQWSPGLLTSETRGNNPPTCFVITSSPDATTTSQASFSLSSFVRWLGPVSATQRDRNCFVFTAEETPGPFFPEFVNRCIWDETIKDIFASALAHTYWTDIERLFDSPTSDSPAIHVTSLADLPEEIKAKVMDLPQASAGEDDLYELADIIAAWVADSSESEQTALVPYLRGLPPRGARILLSALADAEARLTSEQLLWTVANFLSSEDKRLAQAAAACLLECGESLGRSLLQDGLENSASLPHARLIQGIMNLLAPK